MADDGQKEKAKTVESLAGQYRWRDEIQDVTIILAVRMLQAVVKGRYHWRQSMRNLKFNTGLEEDIHVCHKVQFFFICLTDQQSSYGVVVIPVVEY